MTPDDCDERDERRTTIVVEKCLRAVEQAEKRWSQSIPITTKTSSLAKLLCCRHALGLDIQAGVRARCHESPDETVRHIDGHSVGRFACEPRQWAERRLEGTCGALQFRWRRAMGRMTTANLEIQVSAEVIEMQGETRFASPRTVRPIPAGTADRYRA